MRKSLRPVFVCLACFIFCNATATGRITSRDTAFNPKRAWKWVSSYALRAGFGVQGSFCYDIGFARNISYGEPRGFVGLSVYAVLTSFPAFQRQETTAAGFRLGAEVYANGALFGIEASPLWAGNQQDFLIAPKFGFGIPDLSGFYAYYFSTNDWAVGRVGKHALGIQVSPYLWRHDKLKGVKKWVWMRRK